MPNSNVYAVVVTHNREKHLEQCLYCLINSEVLPTKIIVVDNASTDSTCLVIHRFQETHSQIEHYPQKINLGGAGGFEIGTRIAYDQGASHVWLMDDDCYVQEDSLKQLLLTDSLLEKSRQIGERQVGLICSKVNWVDGTVCEMNQPTVNWDYLSSFTDENKVIKVESASFVSCLIKRQAIEKFGFPIGKFFIWFDDAEYTLRISKQFDCYCALSSQVVHATPRNEGVWFGNINQYNIWKFRYGARNESWYRLHKESLSSWLFYLSSRWNEMKKGKVSYKYRVRILASIIIGTLGWFLR
ncbi:glycosyltransferase [Vibrio lamellibrachiae]|uniref:glycosyltransferase n=1 Tax=Vibrio lamellibrachiae TaxID=2910253 RepID=UPI003D0E2213